MTTFLSVSEVSRRLGLSVDTLRYYEKIGLIRAIHRTPSGRRAYAPADLAWLEFILRLRETGMPIRTMCHYAELRAQGDATLAARRELLERHAGTVCQEVARLEQHLARIQDKVALYRTLEQQESDVMAPSSTARGKRHASAPQSNAQPNAQSDPDVEPAPPSPGRATKQHR